MKTTLKIAILASLLLIGVASSFALLAGAPVANAAACQVLSRNLMRGSSGQDVFQLQYILIQEGLLHTTQPTYYFGNLTFGAVVSFQAKYGILRTGFVGPLTRTQLNTLGCQTTTNPIVGPGQHCGGNIMNPPICQSGYYCAPVPGSNLPFGDVGGICVSNNQTSNRPPVINGVSGPTVLSVGQSGTWTINASDPENGSLNYSVVWGDQVVYPPMMYNGASSNPYVQTTTFTHAYASSGTYTAVFYVSDNAGNTTSSSMSVQVTNTNSISPYINYLQPSSGVVGSNVTIVGSGFTSTGNRIKFGNLGSEYNPVYNLNSYNGTTLTFAVPSGNYYACQNSTPACYPPNYFTQPGNYNISVINANGTSNEVAFTVASADCTPYWQCGWGSCTNGYQSMTIMDANHCGVGYQGTPGIACPALARVCQ